MTKADIVNEITKNTGIDKVTVLTTLEAFMDTVKDSLSKEENVYLRGFGSFVVKKRAQKTARNISKNTTIIIPEHNIPAFKPAKTFTPDSDSGSVDMVFDINPSNLKTSALVAFETLSCNGEQVRIRLVQ